MLTLFYDPHCGLCTNFKNWIIAQPAYVYLNFVPYDGADAEKLCPGISKMKADQEIVVLADDGQIWQGSTAWIVCLWALREYRPWAFRLATPVFLPLVRKACYLLSENRLQLSRLLRLRAEEETLVRDINETPLNCDDGMCKIPELQKVTLSFDSERAEVMPPKLY